MTILKSFRYIHKEAIEAEATEVLQQMQSSPLYAPSFPLDSSRVAEFLGLDVVWDSIPPDEEGVVAARILPLERLIEINGDIPQLQGGFGESTIAHEIGHWILHIERDQVHRIERLQAKGVRIAVEPLLCRSGIHLRGMEWQAQYFASCLLMPESVLKERQEGRDLRRWQDLYEMAEELGVTISNLVHRLTDLGWIYIPDGTRQIWLDGAAPCAVNP